MITEVDSQTTHDELSENVTLVAPASTDEVLVAAAKLGDHQAFLELWTRHSSRASKATYRITGNREDAEDAIQDAWESLSAFEHLRWQGTIHDLAHAHCDQFVANDSSEKTCARPETSMDIGDGDTWRHWEIADQAKSVEEICTGQESVERLKRAIRRLQPPLRIVVETLQSEARSVKEVAELVGTSVAATKSRLLRARKILRRLLI